MTDPIDLDGRALVALGAVWLVTVAATWPVARALDVDPGAASWLVVAGMLFRPAASTLYAMLRGKEATR